MLPIPVLCEERLHVLASALRQQIRCQHSKKQDALTAQEAAGVSISGDSHRISRLPSVPEMMISKTLVVSASWPQRTYFALSGLPTG